MSRGQGGPRSFTGQFTITRLLGRSAWRGRRRRHSMLPTSMDETLYDVVGNWNEENRDHARSQHAAEHGKTKQYPAMCAGSRGHHQRKHAENEGEGGHQNGTKT